jgi:cytochrome c oxidase assembly protein subunit 15
MSLPIDTEAIQLSHKRRAVAKWLLLGVVMILIQILLGGVTRLTGSGLSITEWKPILGALPPMNDQEWQSAFELYKLKAAGQFISQNSDYTLSDFKAIYFWEWMHREWARLLGVVFLLGFGYFFVKKYFDQYMVRPFIVLFILGALQGAVGWIMVASGLNPEDTHVSHIKLALHFMFALVLLCYTFWFALKLLLPAQARIQQPKLFRFTLILLLLLAVQLKYGAFMAGLKAAPVAATWPDVNGAYLPESIHSFGASQFNGIHIWADNPIVIHFVHRSLAYLLTILVLIWFVQCRQAIKQSASALLSKSSAIVLGLLLLQVVLGVVTVLNGALMTQSKFLRFELFAELHQMVAIFLLMSVVFHLYLFRKK